MVSFGLVPDVFTLGIFFATLHSAADQRCRILSGIRITGGMIVPENIYDAPGSNQEHGTSLENILKKVSKKFGWNYK